MQKAFEIIPTDTEVDPNGSETADLVKTVTYRTVIVKTRDHVGQAVIVAGRIVTSLFLVRNEKMVDILIPKVGQSQAVVTKRDESNNIALLQPVELGSHHTSNVPSFGQERINTGPIAAFSDPLIMADSRNGKPQALIVSMLFVSKVCPRKEEVMWRFERDIPAGLVGGGIWNIEGALTGLSLAVKDSLLKSSPDYRTHLYALPAEPILEFVESN